MTDIKIETDIFPQYLEHFKSQLLYLEVIKNDVQILFDGGGHQDRHQLMTELMKRSFHDFPASKKLRFWVFTGDNRPTNHVNGEPLFTISGSRILQDFVIPDPYSLRWPHAKVDDFHEYCKNIQNYSLETSDKIAAKVIWRGCKMSHPSRQMLIENLEKVNINFFDVKHVDNVSDKDFLHMVDQVKNAVLLELPGQGYSARMKYLLHAYRPLLVVERNEWDHATINLEPGVHYISSYPEFNFIVAHAKMILDNYGHFLQMSSQTQSIITEIMKRENISRSLTEKIKKYV